MTIQTIAEHSRTGKRSIFQIMIPGGMTRIGNKVFLLTGGGKIYPPGVLIAPDDGSYLRFISNTWYD